jgi:hypothetical protein
MEEVVEECSQGAVDMGRLAAAVAMTSNEHRAAVEAGPLGGMSVNVDLWRWTPEGYRFTRGPFGDVRHGTSPAGIMPCVSAKVEP